MNFEQTAAYGNLREIRTSFPAKLTLAGTTSFSINRDCCLLIQVAAAEIYNELDGGVFNST